MFGRWLYFQRNPDITAGTIEGFGKEIGKTGKLTDILMRSRSKKIRELKSLMEGNGLDDGINVLSGLNSNPLRYRTQFCSQFIDGYLKAIESLGELEYIFDARKLGENGEAFIKGQFKDLFIAKAEEVFNANPTLFKGFDKLDGTDKIFDADDFIELVNSKQFNIDHPIFNFIKIQ